MSSIASTPRHFPSRIADLGFTVALPEDWIAHELPDEQPDFSSPSFLHPLAIVTARNAAMAFACAARPAYEDGSLHDWMWFLLRHNGLEPRGVGMGEAGGHPAMVGEAVQDSDLGRMIVRFALLEDGGRMVHFSLTAPDLFEDVARAVWFAAVASFKLESPRGSTVPMHPPVAAEEPGAPSPAPAAAGEGEEKSTTFASHALAADAASFDPEEETNARLRNNGIGFVPNLVSRDDAARSATFAVSALMAAVTVPYGWHIIDDSRRTLVFEPSGKTQISLNLIHHEGREVAAVLDELEANTRDEHPAPEFVRGDYQGMAFIGVRSITINDSPVEQYHMLLPAPQSDAFVRARVTTTAEERIAAGNLADLILRSVTAFPCAQDEEPPADWRERINWLTDRGRMDEMEQVLRANIDHLGLFSSIAHQHRRRMNQLLAAGDREVAAASFRAAADFIWRYAAGATSGGEGAALSRERDEFRRELVAEFGSDPEA